MKTYKSSPEDNSTTKQAENPETVDIKLSSREQVFSVADLTSHIFDYYTPKHLPEIIELSRVLFKIHILLRTINAGEIKDETEDRSESLNIALQLTTRLIERGYKLLLLRHFPVEAKTIIVNHQQEFIRLRRTLNDRAKLRFFTKEGMLDSLKERKIDINLSYDGEMRIPPILPACAAQYNHQEISDYFYPFMEHSIDSALICNQIEEFKRFLPDIKDQAMLKRLLWKACEYERTEIVRLFISELESKRITFEDGTLMWAIGLAAKHRQHDVIKAIVKYKHFRINYQNIFHETALVCAARDAKNITAVKILSEQKDVDVNRCDGNLRTPLYIAARDGLDRITRFLLSHSPIDVYAISVEKRTALEVAIQFRQRETIKELIEHKKVNLFYKNKHHAQSYLSMVNQLSMSNFSIETRTKIKQKIILQLEKIIADRECKSNPIPKGFGLLQSPFDAIIPIESIKQLKKMIIKNEDVPDDFISRHDHLKNDSDLYEIYQCYCLLLAASKDPAQNSANSTITLASN